MFANGSMSAQSQPLSLDGSTGRLWGHPVTLDTPNCTGYRPVQEKQLEPVHIGNQFESSPLESTGRPRK